MQRVHKQYLIDELSKTKDQLLSWGNQHNTVVWLDSNTHYKAYTQGFLAVDTLSSIETNYNNAFSKLKNYVTNLKDFCFGFLGYDLKNDVEKLQSNNIDPIEFPDLFFFQPKKLIEVKKDKIIFRYPDFLANEIETDWIHIQHSKPIVNPKNNLTIKSRINKTAYISQVEKALHEIHLGNVYELNFCQEFFSTQAEINPVNTYQNLNKISKAPFATFFKHNHLHLLSASPERFLRKEQKKLTSEPIKGTAKRYKTDPKKDQNQKTALKNNTKEIAENIMIVDLVRNDLSHIAQKGTVKVDELCEIYSFKQVHQMISTISCQLKENIHPVDAIKACYPMGSMTGAPKIAAMELIEILEANKRGIYSGAVGYFTPELDFDFNVVIRSIAYNSLKKYVSFSVGSAITAKAVPEQEYNECLLKAKAMREVLSK